ncbi:hypothetical protein IV487_09820 [Enterococcus saccharolyticus]|uniref:hypothetical protein n=1 Tax=Enterococcus saccharolyticus TaxID=41997 RepID=UPI001E6395A5|nr:hypothetical protein [Enterococcus saccharolyticus]MCD5002760.1 hypothetical protein [Enterococcus saccharolyticus]
MKIPFNLKEKIIEAAEHIYDVAKKDVEISVKKTGVKISKPRPTRHTIKWRAKNH